jgi:hypothetical protein
MKQLHFVWSRENSYRKVRVLYIVSVDHMDDFELL